MPAPADDPFREGADSGRSIWLTIPSRIELLELVDGLVQAILSQLDLDEEVAIAIATSVIEAGTNAIQHGNRHAPERPVRFRIQVDEQFETWVRDTGPGFDLDRVLQNDPTRTEDLLKFRGRGIFIMRKMMDQVEFTMDPQVGTTVHLSKRIRAAQGGATEP